MNNVLIPPDTASRYMIRRWIADEAERLATAYWWGICSIDDANEELRDIARMKAARAKMTMALAESVARSTLTETIDRHENAHFASLSEGTEHAATIIATGATLREVQAALARWAATRTPLPPPAVLDRAISDAAKARRRDEFFWRSRVRSES